MTEVNLYNGLDEFSYNCIKFLMNNNELIWKLLYYSDANAWRDDASHPSLDMSQKGSLIFDGINPETNYRVFMDFGLDDVWNSEACILRIAPVDVIPDNNYIGKVIMGFEVYCHSQMNTMSNYKTRTMMIMEQLIQTFNNQAVAGLGRMFFDASIYSRCRISPIGRIPYKGRSLTMCNWSSV